MKEIQKKIWNQLEQWTASPYRIYMYCAGSQSENTFEAAKKHFEGYTDYRACFSQYMRGSYTEREKNPVDKELRYNFNFSAKFKRLYILYNKAYSESLTEKHMTFDPAVKRAYSEYFESNIEMLNSYMDVIYDEETSIITVDPGETHRNRYNMLLFLTKLRTLFELPYALSPVYSKFFHEDWPEITEEQLSYLFDVFIVKGGSGHGIYPALNSGSGKYGEFKPFSQLMADTQERKISGINSGDNPAIPYLPKMAGINTYTYPDSYLERYNLLLTKKDEIYKHCFKQTEHEKSVFSV